MVHTWYILECYGIPKACSEFTEQVWTHRRILLSVLNEFFYEVPLLFFMTTSHQFQVVHPLVSKIILAKREASDTLKVVC